MRFSPSKWVALCATLVVTVGLLASCGGSGDPNRNSGGDESRLTALEVPIKQTVIDSVNFNGGDMTDWKFFSTPANGRIDFTIAFDSPLAKGTAIIRDARGVQLERLDARGDEPQKLTTMFRGPAGNYYIEIFVRVGSSDYTLEVTFEQGG